MPLIRRKSVVKVTKYKLAIIVVAMAAILALAGCASSPSENAQTTSRNAVSEQTVGSYTQTMTDDAATQMERELGAFEITAEQRELAKDNEGGYEPLDAGRGNPNWINAKARYAYTRLMDFATSECQLDMAEGDMAGHGQRDDVSERFDAAMNPDDEIDKFLLDAVAYCVDELSLDKDELLMELTNGIIGDYYPDPSRCLSCTEVILNDYLQSTLYDGKDLKESTPS